MREYAKSLYIYVEELCTEIYWVTRVFSEMLYVIYIQVGLIVGLLQLYYYCYCTYGIFYVLCIVKLLFLHTLDD